MNTTEPSNHYECIEIKIEKGIFRLIINRPEVRNALDNNMLAEIDTALDEAKQNDEVKVLIIEGAGGKSFAAGADIKQLHARKPLEALIPGMQGLYSKIENLPKVTIAVVNGYALGGDAN